MKKILTAILYLAVTFSAKADEGMWLPFLLQQLNTQEMYIRGLKIPVEEIYNANKNSLKDAVVLFGGGCTGEMISYEGLLLTNHHCGYSSIQSHSTVEHNYLKEGFWAMSKDKEIPCPGLTATFIVRMEDVTQQIVPFLKDEMNESERSSKVSELVLQIEKKAAEGTGYAAQVKSIFDGNEYILIISEVFKDVRLVGAPPSSIGNFGGETDNWMWPRHTGDFSIFRVYAGNDNKPAEYNPDNKPFKPRYAFSISLKGVQEGDYTMVYGFPGLTQEYQSSNAVDMIVNTSNPNRVKLRDKRVEVMETFMKQDEKIFIQYASKLRKLANAYKKWKGETAGLKRLEAVKKKQTLESDFTTWLSSDAERKNKYGNIIPDFSDIYNDYRKYVNATDYYTEAGLAPEIINYAAGFKKLVELSKTKAPDINKINEESNRLLKGSAGFFKDYHAPLDQQLLSSLYTMYSKNVEASLLPPLIIEHSNNMDEYASMIFKKSNFTSEEKVKSLLNDFKIKKASAIEKDPAYMLAMDIINTYNTKVALVIKDKKAMLVKLNRNYVAGLREMQEGRKFYPDANSTLRLTYGNVKGYFPRDGVQYNYLTTIEGIMQKKDSLNEDFEVPARLVELYKAKDYGRYSVNGTIPVAFTASNHTTGGNSGSPVLNEKGHLIGTNFDRVWEGTMSDIMYDPEQCRNISVDIHYTLFIIDKFAGATNLIKEMDILQ